MVLLHMSHKMVNFTSN